MLLLGRWDSFSDCLSLTPFFLYQLGKSSFNFGETFIETFILLLFVPVAILFLMFGLFIQYKGLVEGIMRGNLEFQAKPRTQTIGTVMVIPSEDGQEQFDVGSF